MPLTPRDEADVAEAIRAALAQDAPLSIEGHGSKSALGRATQRERVLSLAALTGVTLYEPQELVLTARAGTPLREIVALLDAQNQQLAFEPMDHAALLGGARDDATIGGVDRRQRLRPAADQGGRGARSSARLSLRHRPRRDRQIRRPRDEECHRL